MNKSVITALLLIVSVLSLTILSGCTTTPVVPAITIDDVNAKVTAAVKTAVSEKDTEFQSKLTEKDNLNAELSAKVDKLTENVDRLISNNGQLSEQVASVTSELKTVTSAKEDLKTQLETAQLKVSELETIETKAEEMVEPITDVEPEVLTKESYTKDELYLNEISSFTVSDRNLGYLVDEKIEFDNEKIDSEEILRLTNLKMDINGKDYGDKVLMVVPENGMAYEYVFDNDLNCSEISKDEPLSFNFLGQPVEISKWTNDELTFSSGIYYLLNEGESITVDGKQVTLKSVGNDYVYVDVSGKSAKLEEGELRTLNGLDIQVNTILAQNLADGSPDMAEIRIGKEVEQTVTDGDEYIDGSIWNWKISKNSIGLTLNDDFDETDVDEDYKALAKGTSISLPNNYSTLIFNGLNEDTTQKYVFATKDEYLRMKGKFLAGLDDYSTVYANETGFFDSDDELINVSELGLDDTDSYLKIVNDTIVIYNTDLTDSNVTINMKNVSDFSADGKVMTDSLDENYRTRYGYIVTDPEKAIDLEEVTVLVPKERLFVSVSIE